MTWNSGRLTTLARGGMALAIQTVWVASALAQVPATDKKFERFEVASVKPNVTKSDRFSSERSPERLVISNMALRTIIGMAYGLDLLQLNARLMGPESLLSKRFDIQAKLPEGTRADGSSLPMLRTLLAERFHLRVHSESKQTRVYALRPVRLGQLGPDLRPSAFNCSELRARIVSAGRRLADAERPHDGRGRPLCWSTLDERPEPGTWRIRNAGPIASLIVDLQGHADRPLVDATGLTGNYEWQLLFSPRSTTEQAPLFIDALRSQLGLRLVSTSAPFTVMVIDDVRMPTPN